LFTFCADKKCVNLIDTFNDAYEKFMKDERILDMHSEVVYDGVLCSIFGSKGEFFDDVFIWKIMLSPEDEMLFLNEWFLFDN